MAKYDLKCQAAGCDTQIEVTCRHEELETAQAVPCPACGQSTMLRVYTSPPTPHFKGSGFYATDYGRRTK